MKALSIVAIVLAGISFIIPVIGVFSAMVASLLAVISFRSQATLSGTVSYTHLTLPTKRIV